MSSFHRVAYRGEILVLKHLTQQSNIWLTAFKFDKETREFVKRRENHLNHGIVGPDIKVLQFSCIVEGATGLKQPCMVIEQLHSECHSTLHFSFLVNSKTLTNVALFRHSYSISCTEFMLSDGPSLSWLCNDKIHFLQWNDNSQSLVHTSYLYPANNKHVTLLWSGIANEELLTVAHSEGNVILAAGKKGFLSSDKLIPSIYSSIVLCLYIDSDCRQDSNSLFTQNVDTHEEVVAGTSRGQLIRFSGGKVVSHYQLPFDDPIHIEVIQAGNGSTYIVVQSKQKKVCVINSSQNQFVNEWSNKDIVLIDDFLENGTEQVCLMQDNVDGDSMLKSYVLTNLTGITMASDQEYLAGKCPVTQVDQSNSESIHSTIQALRTRLQASNSHFAEVRSEYDDKTRMIDDTCNTLCKMTDETLHIGAPPIQARRNTSNLVCLIGDEISEDKKQDEHVQQGSDHKVAAISAKKLDEHVQQGSDHKVTAIWQRVIADNWIIGVDLENCEKSNMSDISLSLVSCTKDCLKSSCRTVFESNNPRLLTLDQEDKIIVPSSKRRKLDKSESNGCVVAMVTSLPTFSEGKRFTGLVALSWTHYHDNRVPSRRVSSCGYVHLDVDQLVSGTLSISQRTEAEDVKRDLTAIKAISTQTMLTLSSPVSTLFNVADALRQEFGSTPVGDFTSGESILLRADEVTGIQQGVALLVNCGTKQVDVTLFTRRPNQIYINIHRIRNALPDGVIINISQAARANSEHQALRGIQNQLGNFTSEMVNNVQQALSKDS